MKYQEFGKDNKETVMLLHGGGLSWWNYREEAKLLENSYHVILPILDGHAGSDRPFTTIEDNASKIISFIDNNLNGHVLLMGGLSLGAQILLEALSQRKDICSFALVESASVIPSKMTNMLIGPSFSSSYGLIKNPGFARMQFKSLHIREDLFEDYYRDTCAIAKDDMISFMKANTSYSIKDSIADTQAKVHIYYGSKETGGIRKSAAMINDRIKGSRLHCLEDLYHGEFSINHPDKYVSEIRQVVS